ncbi:helix-turn-helix domain-containing protein [Mongoliimonas terrestris]|uniref:helix-turn-helix domain-containing protein n=1 Tax=Mongoliimonas terrestris TaxID=1709001 RepID=UPI0009FA3A51
MSHRTRGESPPGGRAAPDRLRSSSVVEPTAAQRSRQPVPERLLTIRDVANLQQTCERTIRRRIASGELPAIRDGRLVRIRPSDLRAYRARQLLE